MKRWLVSSAVALALLAAAWALAFVVPTQQAFDFRGNDEGGAQIGAGMSGSISAFPVRAGLGWGNAPQSAQLVVGVSDGVAGLYRGRLYVWGGVDALGDPRSELQIAPLALAPDAGWTLQPWVLGTPMPSPRAGQAGTLYDGCLFAAGGLAGASSSDIAFARIDPASATGDIASPGWQTAAFPEAIFDDAALVGMAGYLYVFGPDSSVYSAAIQDDCSLAGPQPAATWSPLGGPTAAAYANHAFVVGTDGGNVLAAAFDGTRGDGTLIARAPALTELPATRGERLLALAGALYVIGGVDGNGATQRVWLAPLLASGNAGDFTEDAHYVGGAQLAGETNGMAVGFQDQVFLVGGVDPASTNTAMPSQVQSGVITPWGTLGEWKQWGGDLSTEIDRCCAAVAEYGSYVYIVGGQSSVDAGYYPDIVIAPITAGSQEAGLGPIQDYTPPLNAALVAWPAAAAWGDLLVISGGVPPGGAPTAQTAVFLIGSDGGLTPVMADAYELAQPRYGHAMVFYRDHVYSIGGCTMAPPGCFATNEIDDISFVNGTWGGLWNTSGPPLPAPAAFPAALAYDGRLYVAGGFDPDAGTLFDAVVSYPIQDGGALGSPRTETSLPQPTAQLAFAAAEGELYALTGCHPGDDLTLCGLVTSNQGYASWVAPISPSNGTVGAWTATSDPPVAGSGVMGGFVEDGALFTIIPGLGATAGGALGHHTEVKGAPVGINGTLASTSPGGPGGQWAATASGSLVAGYDMAVASHGVDVFAVGGCNDPSCAAASPIAVYRTNLGLAGLAPWRQISPPPVPPGPWHGEAAVICGTSAGATLYLLGGAVGAMPTSAVWALPFEADGGWTSAAPLPTARTGFAAACENGTLYVTGGFGGMPLSPLGDVLTASTTGGALTWSSSPTVFPPRGRHAMAVHRGRLYVVGGTPYATGVTAGEVFDDVTLVDPGSGLDAGVVVARLPMGPRVDLSAAVLSGRLVVSGGQRVPPVVGSMPSPSADVAVAGFNADGTLTEFTFATPLPEARQQHRLVAASDTLVVVGGGDGTMPPYADATLTARPNWAAQRAAYSQRVELGASLVSDVTIDGSAAGGFMSLGLDVASEHLQVPIASQGVAYSVADGGVFPSATSLHYQVVLDQQAAQTVGSFPAPPAIVTQVIIDAGVAPGALTPVAQLGCGCGEGASGVCVVGLIAFALLPARRRRTATARASPTT